MNKLINKSSKIIVGLLILVVALLPTIALASTLPTNHNQLMESYTSNDTLDIIDVAVFSDYYVSGDWLIVANIDNTKSPYYPFGTVSQYFMVNLLSVDNTSVIAATPLLFWQEAPISIYLSPSMVTTLTYGDNYTLEVVGTYSVPPSDNYTLTSTNWRGSDLRGLDSWIINTAYTMNDYYGWATTSSDLLNWVSEVGVSLSTNGGSYFTTAIPNIAYVRPDIFTAKVSQPTNRNVARNNVYDDTKNMSTEVGGQVSDWFTLLGNTIGVTSKNAGGILILLAIVGLTAITLTSLATGLGIIIFGVILTMISSEFGITSVIIPVMAGFICLVIFARKIFPAST